MVPLLERLLLVPIDPAVPLAPRRKKPPELIAIDEFEEKVVFPSTRRVPPELIAIDEFEEKVAFSLTRRVPPELIVTFPERLPMRFTAPSAMLVAAMVALPTVEPFTTT